MLPVHMLLTTGTVAVRSLALEARAGRCQHGWATLPHRQGAGANRSWAASLVRPRRRPAGRSCCSARGRGHGRRSRRLTRDRPPCTAQGQEQDAPAQSTTGLELNAESSLRRQGRLRCPADPSTATHPLQVACAGLCCATEAGCSQAPPLHPASSGHHRIRRRPRRLLRGRCGQRRRFWPWTQRRQRQRRQRQQQRQRQRPHLRVLLCVFWVSLAPWAPRAQAPSALPTMSRWRARRQASD